MLEVSVQEADEGRSLLGLGKEGGELLEGDDGRQGGGEQEVVC